MDYVIELTDEQERIQKKTFTNWVNIYLAKAIPADYVRDLFVDIRDGVKLVRLLEVLAGVRLPIERAAVMQRVHHLSNVKTALDFLTDKRKIKLVNINPADVVDGRPAIVLGLIWSIILSFNIDEQGKVLHAATAAAETSEKDQSTAKGKGAVTNGKLTNGSPVASLAHKKALLAWVNRCISPFLSQLGVEVKDFGVSWRDGRVFCALVHGIEAESLDLRKVKANDNKANLEMAFSTAEQKLGIPRLLDVEDVDVDKPDERSIMTYISQFLKEYPTGKKRTKSVDRKATRGAGSVAPAQSLETSLDAVDSAIDPSLVLSASTVSLHNPTSSAIKQTITTPTTLLDDEGIRSLLAATSSSLSGSEEEMEPNPDTSQSMPNIVQSSISPVSPRRQGWARTYADLRLARVAKTYSRCRAIANIRVTADRTEETKNAVKIVQIENQIKDSNAQAEEERNFMINIKELISRIRYEPLEVQNLIQELEEFYEAEQQHKSLTACLLEMNNRKRQGILLGLIPSELAEIEAKWTQVKPALDEWRWRLDESLPGDWATVSRWLGQLERCLSACARLAVEMDAASTSDADAATRREKFFSQLADLEEKFMDRDRISEVLELLIKTNSPDEPSALPASVVNAINNRFQNVCREAETSLRRTSRLHLRWKLADEIGIINAYINGLKNTRFQKLEDAMESVEQIKAWKKSMGLPDAMDADITSLDALCKESEEKSVSSTTASTGEQPVAGLLTIQIKAGGGTLIMRDIAETERVEASMFLSSLRVRWADAQRDLMELEKSSLTLVDTWQAYETLTPVRFYKCRVLDKRLNNRSEAEKKLRDEKTTASDKRFLLSQMKEWHNRLSALRDLGAALLGQSTISTGEAINSELDSMLQQLDSIINEVERSTQAESVELLKRDLGATVNRINDLLQNAYDLLNKEVLLPQTTSMGKAEEATSEYRTELLKSKENIRKSMEFEYKIAKEILEKMVAAANEGEIDYSEVERWKEETERLHKMLQQMTDEQIDNRLSELDLAMREAVALAVKLAQMSEWIEEAEIVTNADIPKTADEIFMDDLASIAPEEAIRRLEKHCNSINDHTKALEEAEGRLEELKSMGLKSVNISELETAIAETRERIKLMLDQTQKREQLLLKQSQTREAALKAAESFEEWLSEAESVAKASMDCMLPLNSRTVAEAQRITQWSLDRLEEQRNAHETFCDKRLVQGTELLEVTNQCFEKFSEVWPEVTVGKNHGSDTEIVAYAREVISRVMFLRQRYADVIEHLPRALLNIRFAIIDTKIGEKLMEASERLRQEESRIECGEEVSSILSEHEASSHIAYFFSPDFLEELPAMMIEMENLLAGSVILEPDEAAQYAKRTEVRGKTLFQLKDRAEQLATNMRDLPERWLDFDAKLAGLEQWTAEVEDLSNQLCSEDIPGSEGLMDPDVATEIARRYRKMLEQFGEMVDSTNSNIALAERYNKILQELITEGGLPPPKIANRRANLARVLNSLHDLETMAPSVRRTAEKIINSLDQQIAAALAEQERAKRMRTYMEEITSDVDLQCIESDEMRRLLAERDALIARVSEEKKASLAYLMQMPTPDRPKTPQIRPAEERILQVWEDTDRMLEEKAANLRTATQATEEFEEVRNRLFNLLGGAKFLLKGAPSSALVSAVSNGQTPITSYEAFAKIFADDNAENKEFSSVDIATYGPSKIQEQTAAIQAHLRSLDKATTDIAKLRAAADLIAEQLGPEKSAELTVVIDHLEKDMALTKSALEERLAALEMANSKWVEIRELTKGLEGSTESKEKALLDIKVQLETFSLSDYTNVAGACAAYRQFLEDHAKNLNKLQSDSAELCGKINDLDTRLLNLMTVEKVDENGNVVREFLEDVDSEVSSVQKALGILLLRQKGINKGCISVEETIASTIAALEEYAQLSGNVETYLDKVDAIRDTEFSFVSLDDVLKAKEQFQLLMKQKEADLEGATSRMRELSPFLKKVPQLAGEDLKLIQRWDATDSWLISHASYIDALIADWSMWTSEMDAISSEWQQLADNVESTSADSSGVTSRRAIQAARQVEAVRLLKARWKALRPQAETVLSLLSSIGPKGAEKITMESTQHAVPRRYNLVGEQIRGLFSMLQEMNTKLEGELDEQDELANDVERLVHMLSTAEKRLSRVTGIWISSAPLFLSTHHHVSFNVSQSHHDDSKPTSDSNPASNTVIDGYINLTEAAAELNSLLAEITGPVLNNIESLMSRVKQFDVEEAAARDRLKFLLREVSLLALRALKRKYICEVSRAYEQNRSKWFDRLCGLRSIQEQLIQTGATVEILKGLPESDETPKLIKAIPVDRSYEEDCVGWLKALNAAKVEILDYKLTSERPMIPECFQEVKEEVKFEQDYTPQELDTASIAAGIFFVTGRRDEILIASSTSLEPFSFYVDVGRIINDCDKLRAGMISHWNSLEVYCSNWLKFVKESDEFASYTAEFLEKTISLVKTAVDLTDTRLERPGNYNRLTEISTQLREWQKAFESPTEDEISADIPLVSRLIELQKEGEKLIDFVASRTLAVRALLDTNKAVLLNASIRLCEIAYELERLTKAYESRETAIREVNDIVKEVEQQAGFRSVSSLAANLLGIDISSELLVADELVDVSSLKMEKSYKSDLDGLLRMIQSSQDLAKLLNRLSKARAYLRAHLPSKLMHLQQSSSAAICAFEVLMNEENPKPSLERLKDDTLRNRVVSRSQCLSDILDEAIKELEEKHQTMTLIETNIDSINSWIDELLPKVQSASHLLSVSANESVISEAIQFTEAVEDPADLLEIFSAEREHYSRLSELTKLEIDNDSEILFNVFESQIKTIATRFGGLISALNGMEDLWKAYLAQDDAVNKELSRESDELKALVDRLDRINLHSGPTLLLLASPKERIEAMNVLAQLFEEAQQIRSEYMDMISRVEALSNRCFNRDTFRMHLKRRKLLRDQLVGDKEKEIQSETQPNNQLDSLSKHCANLSFRLASVDTQVKRCMEGLCKRMSKVQNDSNNAWSAEINVLTEGLEKLGSFAELPLLLKAERRESIPNYFSERNKDIEESQKRVDNLEAELFCIVDLYRTIQRFQHCENGPRNVGLGDEVSNAKNRTMIAMLRQSLAEYAIHVDELHSTLKEMFTTTSQVTAALTEVDKNFETALANIENSLDLSSCEIALAQFSSTKNDLEPIKSELRTLQTLGNHSGSTLQAAISTAASLIAVPGAAGSKQAANLPSQDIASQFNADFVSLDKKFLWMTSILDEAGDRLSTLIDSFKHYDYRVMEAKAWLHQSEVSLKSKSEGADVSRSLDTEEAETYLAMIQNLVVGFNDGKRLVDVMEGSASELQTEAMEVNRWVGNIRQTPHFHPSSSHVSSPLPLFREGLMKTSDKLKDDLAKYLAQLNAEKERAEIRLNTCSNFCDNCSRFFDWLSDCETKWNIPSIGSMDTYVIANEESFLWEKQTMLSTYKQILMDIQLHEVLLKELFQSAELDYESEASANMPSMNARFIDARKRFHWLQECVAARLTSIEDKLKKAEEKEVLQRAFHQSVESVHRRFTALEWEIIELSTWEKLKPVTSEPVLEILEEVVLQLSSRLQSITGFSRELEAAMEAVGDASNSPRLADETREMLVKLRNLRLNTEKYIKACLTLSNNYRPLNNDLNKFETRIAEKAYISELTSLDVCRLNNEEWYSLRNDILVEQSMLWQIEEEMRNENFEEKFTTTETAFEEFLNAINEIAQTSTSQCSAAHQFKSKLLQLREMYNSYKRNIADNQKGLETQLSKGDLYHDELKLCQDLLNKIETDLEDVLNSAILHDDIKIWTPDTQDLVCKVTTIERRLCDFQTKELEGLMVIAQSGEEFLPLAAQTIQDRWSDLVNRAMNARGAAEVALTSIQNAADAFVNMLTWIRESENRLLEILNKPTDEPPKSLMDAEEPRFIADGWSSLTEAQSLRLSKLMKLHTESVAKRKMVLSTTEELGRLKGPPPSKAEVSVIRALEQELADNYADLIEHSQAAVSSEQEVLKTIQAALEDTSAALNATEKLSDRANSLLFREELGASLDWQQTCFNDFLSIELATVRELIERSRRWTSLLPQPDSQFAEVIASKLLGELSKIEEKVNERLRAMGKFLAGLGEISQRIAEEEAWQCALSVDMNPAFRDFPDDLAKKREMIVYFETKVDDVENHIEAVKHLSDDFDRLTSAEGKVFATPQEIISQIQTLHQSLALQRQTADNQRVRWIQIAEQHARFLRDLCETYYYTSSLATRSANCFGVFRDICKTVVPSAEMTAWARETCLLSDRFHDIVSTVNRLNDEFVLVRSAEGGEGESRISSCLKDLKNFTKSFEQVVERRQILLDRIGLRVNEFNRCVQRFTQTIGALDSSFQQILSSSTMPANHVLRTLLEDAKNGLSQEENSLEKEKTAVQSLLSEICSDEMRTPDLEELDESTAERVKWEKRTAENTASPPEVCSLDAAGMFNELIAKKAALITAIRCLSEEADKLSVATKYQCQTRKSCKDWLSEASKQLEVCRNLMIEHASSHAISIDQKANSLRMRQRNVNVLIDAHKANEPRFTTNSNAEKDMAACHENYLKCLIQECTRRGITPNFATSNDSLDAAALYSEWKNLMIEMGALQESVQMHLVKCEDGSNALAWMTKWLREVEKRILVEDTPSLESYRPTLSHRGHSLRAYTEEVETLGKIAEKQQEVVKFWQDLTEEIGSKKTEFDECELKISTTQSDSSTTLRTFRQRLDNAAETTKKFLQQNTEGANFLNQICQRLTAFNNWALAIQQRAATMELPIQNFLSQESASTVEQGEEHISSVSGIIEHFLAECAWAREKICPLSAACLLATDLLSHLTVVWQSTQLEMQTIRQKCQSDSEALDEFSAQLTTLTSWLKGKDDVLEVIRTELDSLHNHSVSSYAEELKRRESSLPSVECALENLAHCLKRKEKVVSDTSELLNQLNARSRDFDALRERLQELSELLSVLKVDRISHVTTETDHLIKRYSGIQYATKKMFEQSKETLSSHQNLLSMFSALQIWQNELKQSLLIVSDFSGDRYTLMARMDWLTNAETIRQKGEKLCSDLKEACFNCLTMSPPDLVPALLSITNERIADFTNLCSRIIDVHSQHTGILASWEKLNAVIAEFDSCLQRTQESIANYDMPYSEDSSGFQSKVDLFSFALNILNGFGDEDLTISSPCVEVHTLRNKFSQLSECHSQLKSLLGEVHTKEDSSVTSAIAHRSNDIKSLNKRLQELIATWGKISEEFKQFSTGCEILGEEVNEFGKQMESLVEESETCSSVIVVNDLIKRCELCLEKHVNFLDTLKMVKEKFSAMAPHTSNSAILELQESLASHQNRYTSIQQMGRSLIKKLKERLETDAKLKTELANHFAALSDAEETLLKLTTSGRLSSNISISKSLSLVAMPCSELTFAFAKFSNALHDYLNCQKQSLINHTEKLSKFQQELFERGKNIQDIVSQDMLDDGTSTQDLSALRGRLDDLFKKTEEVKKINEACETFIMELDSQVTKAIEEFGLCIDSFVQLEAESRHVSDEFLANSESFVTKLSSISARMSEETPLLAALKRLKLKLPTHDTEWKDYVGVCDVLLNEFSALKQRVEQLKTTICSEVQDLTLVDSLHRKLTDLHSAQKSRLSQLSSYVNQTPTSLDTTSWEKMISQLTAYATFIKTSKSDLESATTDYTREANNLLSSLADSVKAYSSHRKQPVGMLITRIEGQKVLFEDSERQAERLDRELSDGISRWDDFIVQLKGLQQWLKTRENDFETVSAAETLEARTNGLRDLEETIRKIGGPMFDRARSCGCSLQSLRPNLSVVNLATSWMNDRYNALIKSLSERQNMLKKSVMAKGELHELADRCSNILERQETQLTELYGQPFFVPSGPSSIEGIEERLRKLEEFQHVLDELKSVHLIPLDERIQAVKDQLRACGFDQTEVSSAVTRIADLWRSYNALRGRSTEILTELEKLAKGGREFHKLTMKMSVWLKEQKEAFSALGVDASITDCADIHELTDRLSKRSNAFHRFCIELLSNGEHHLAECSASAAYILGVAKSLNVQLVQDSSSSKVHSQESLIENLQKCFQTLSSRATKQKDELSAMLLSLTAYTELFSNLQTWVSSVEKGIAKEAVTSDSTKEMELFSTPSSFLTIRSANVLSQLAQDHERARQIGEKQAHLDVLLSRSNRLLEEWGSSEVTRFAAQRTGTLSRRFVELTIQVKRQIEGKTMNLKNIECLQGARNAYTAWEKDIRSKFGNACHEENLNEVLSCTKRVLKSLEMGDVLLESCRQWALNVQADALGSKAVDPILANDLVVSYETLKNTISQKLESIEKQVAQQRTKQLSIISVSSWLETAEQRLQAVISSVYSSPQANLKTAPFISTMAFYELAVDNGLSELSTLQTECTNKEIIEDDAQLSSRLYAIKLRLAQCLSELEERAKNLKAYREAIELVSIRQKMTLERYVQITGKGQTIPETVSQLLDSPTSILEVLLSAYDAERRLTVLRGINDELVIDGRQLLEAMIESADRLISSCMEQHDDFLAGVVSKQNEELRKEQTNLERVSKKSIELLESVTDAWKGFTRTEEDLSDWLTEMEQTSVRPIISANMPTEERKRVLSEMQTYLVQLNKKAPVFERHLSDADHLKLQIPQFQAMEKAKQLFTRYNYLTNSVQAQFELHSAEVTELSCFEGLMAQMLVKIEDFKSLLEECRVENRFLNHTDLVSKQIAIKKMMKELNSFKNSEELANLLTTLAHVKGFVSPPDGEEIARRVAGISTFVADSICSLDASLAFVSSRLATWENWFSLVNRLGEDLDRKDASFKCVLKDVKDAGSSNPEDALKKRKEAIDKLQEMRSSLTSLKPDYNELKRLTNDSESEMLDPVLFSQSNEISARMCTLVSEIQTHRDHLRRSWEGLFAFSNKVNAADQWLLVASVRLTALNNANPDGPKATEFLIKNCETFKAEVTNFVENDLLSLILEGRKLENTKESKRKKKRGKIQPIGQTDTFKQLLEQLEALRNEAGGLIRVTQEIERILLSKAEEWTELLTKIQSGETYVEVNLARWWSEYVDHSQPETADSSHSITPTLRLKMIQQPEALLEEIVDQIKEVEIKEVEKRRFDLESASSKVTSPWTPVQIPSIVQQRLQRAAMDESDITSGSVGLDTLQTSGNKLRTRVENLEKSYAKQVEKLKALSEQMNNWKSRWDQQLLCEAEVAEWLQTKESEINELFEGRGLEALDLGTSSLKHIRSELLAKRDVIDELADWRQNILDLPLPYSEGDGSDPIGDLRHRLNSLVRRIGKRLELHKQFIRQAKDATQAETDVQKDLEKMVQRISRGHSALHLHTSSRAQKTLRNAQSTSVIYPHRGPSPLSVQLPNSSSPVAGSLEWLWYSPTSVLDQPLSTSPSPPRFSLRPHPYRAGRVSRRLGRSTPLINIGDKESSQPPSSSLHNFAMTHFTDIKLGEEDEIENFDAETSPSSHTIVSSSSPPPLLLARSISPCRPRVGRGWRRRWSLQAHSSPDAGFMMQSDRQPTYYSSCADLMSTPPVFLPSRTSILLTASDIARRRYRRRMEQAGQMQNEGTGA
ncbi:hypothetical protein Aperf_G00000041104 [Anoplocephala perfoliata]